jgi:hypothetical protein
MVIFVVDKLSKHAHTPASKTQKKNLEKGIANRAREIKGVK